MSKLDNIILECAIKMAGDVEANGAAVPQPRIGEL